MSAAPRENLYRSAPETVEFRSSNTNGVLGTLAGYAAVFGQWTEINSVVEGRFKEQIAKGAFANTIRGRMDKVKVLFNHGRDNQIGDKPMGPIRVLEEDDYGLRYEVDLLDTAYNREIVPGLKAGLYGSSFRFSSVREDFNSRPARSEGNKEGIPERTLQELRLAELGPCTFAAYEGATAGMRSMTDELLVDRLLDDPERFERLRRAAEARRPSSQEDVAAEALKVTLAERAAYIEEMLKPLPKRYPWQKLESSPSSSPIGEAPKTRHSWQWYTAEPEPPKSLFLFTDGTRPGYDKGEPDCSRDEPKLFTEGITPRHETLVHVDASVWTKFKELKGSRERAYFLTGYRSGPTIHVVGTVGDFTGTSRSCRVDQDVATLFDGHQASIQGQLSVVGLLHTHPVRGAVLPSRTDLRNWCSVSASRSDHTYIGVIVAPGAVDTSNKGAWDAVDRGVFVAHPDGRVYHARHALEAWHKAA